MLKRVAHLPAGVRIAAHLNDITILAMQNGRKIIYHLDSGTISEFPAVKPPEYTVTSMLLLAAPHWLARGLPKHGAYVDVGKYIIGTDVDFRGDMTVAVYTADDDGVAVRKFSVTVAGIWQHWAYYAIGNVVYIYVQRSSDMGLDLYAYDLSDV